MLACIACNCIYIVFCYRFVLGTAHSCVTGCRSDRDLERVRLFVVHGNRHHDDGTGQTRRGPLSVSRKSRRRVVHGYERQSGRIVCVCVLAVDSLLALSECVSCDNRPLTV